MSGIINIFRGIWQFIERCLCVAVALIFLQIPVYIDQYVEVLAQAREEARPVYEETQRRAFQENFSPEAYLNAIADTTANADSVQLLRNSLEHYQDYDQSIKRINGAEPWKRPYVFYTESKRSIRQAMDFKPGVNLDVESLVYGLIGVLLCSLLLFLLTTPVRKARRKRKSDSA